MIETVNSALQSLPAILGLASIVCLLIVAIDWSMRQRVRAVEDAVERWLASEADTIPPQPPEYLEADWDDEQESGVRDLTELPPHRDCIPPTGTDQQ